jgi:ribose 5-phosphate isomerase A
MDKILTQDQMKAAVAKKVVDDFVKSGMKLGLGSGTTSEFAVRYIGQLYNEGKLKDIVGVPTSTQTELVCHELGIPITTLNDPIINGRLDLAIDGPDEVDRFLNLTKGGGGCLTQEKIVGYAADEFIIIGDETKIVDDLGLIFPIPLEVMAFARVSVSNSLKEMGAEVAVRMAQRKMGAVITDNGNIILDILFKKPIKAEEYEVTFNTLPGVVENGLFAVKKSRVFISYDDGSVRELMAQK